MHPCVNAGQDSNLDDLLAKSLISLKFSGVAFDPQSGIIVVRIEK